MVLFRKDFHAVMMDPPFVKVSGIGINPRWIAEYTLYLALSSFFSL